MNKVQFRYKPRVKIKQKDNFDHEITIFMEDRNDPSCEDGFSMVMISNIELLPNEYLAEIIQSMLHEMLDKIASEKQNLHYEHELHKECVKQWKNGIY